MSETETRKRRIAVVAIHGVGDHPQFATAREIGDLLSNLEYEPTKTPRYAPFTEVTKRINVRPVTVVDKAEGLTWTDQKVEERNTWGPMDAIARTAFQSTTQPWRAAETDNSVNSLDHQYMKGQLIKYQGEHPEDTYQCLRLEGTRIAPVVSCGAEPASPDADSAGKVAMELRQSGVDLAPQPTGEAASDGPPQSQADPAAPGTQEKTVHIYEMYWADLSQLGGAFTRIFGELYQLLFHLGSVSVNNVLAGAIHFCAGANADANADARTGNKWKAFSQAQWFAVAILAWPIPILNLYMAALVPVVLLVSLMRSYLSAQGEFIVLDTLTAMLCVVVSGYTLLRFDPKIHAVLYVLPLFLFGGLGMLFGFLGSPWNRDRTEEIFAAIVLALTLGGVWLVLQAYDRQRPGSKSAALWVGLALAAACLIVFAAGGFPVGAATGYPTIAISLNLLEVGFGLLTLSWATLYFAYIWAHIAGSRAVRAVRSNPDRVRARRTRWTAQLILALSSLIFITLTISVWTGVVKVAISALPGQKNAQGADPCSFRNATAANSSWAPSKTANPDDPCSGPFCAPVRYQPVTAALYRFIWNHGLSRFHSVPARAMERLSERYQACPPLVSGWANQMFLAAGIGFLPIFLLALLIAFLITLWAMIPSVCAEISPPDSGPADQSEAERIRIAEKLKCESSSLGLWLDRGFRFMRWGGEVLYWTMWLPPFIVVFGNFAFIDWIYVNGEDADTLTKVLGTLVAGTAVGMLGFAGRLRNLAGGFRPLLRVMLDVDNWLREHPRESNPTARICGRYVSLLRYISAWRDSDGSQYDAMVIIAHSQGTVITADFLRFLQAEKEQAGSMEGYDPELKHFGEMPVYFFTMGCPLHQLYGLRFPYLYGWARNEVPGDVLQPGKIPDIGSDDAPRPARLRVARWVNAYRSGDYVGRYLWRGGIAGYKWEPAATNYDEEWDPPAGKPERVSADKAGHRIECCIGPGAHTHYWDHTAGFIAEVLDRMINNA